MMRDWSLPYPSTREAIFARNVVAASQPLAAQAGLEMFRRGGNAIDAAIATAITLTVVEPCSNGIGSDAFAIVHDGNEIHGLNGSGRSPELLQRNCNELADGMPATGWIPVTVPGAVSAWVALHERFGSLDFAEVFEPAIHYATNGFLVSRQTAAGWQRATERYSEYQAWSETFLKDGSPPLVGEVMCLPDHAATLLEIAKTKGESFYRGSLAQQIDAASRKEGGLIRASDLAAHTCDWVAPISIELGDSLLYELPPNGQGIAALIAMKIVLEAGIDMQDCDLPQVLHVQIEAMKRAFADAHAFVATPEIAGRCEELLEKCRIATHASLIGKHAASVDPEALPKYSSTVYLATGDASGMMVSFIQSNFEGFGSGIVIPNTGIAMQNRGRGFSMDPSHPNCVAPSKRPFHTIIPAFLESLDSNGKKFRGSFGVMGGPMQPQGHLQVACRMIFGGQNPQAALDAPRWRLLGGRNIAIEPGFPSAVYEALRALGHELEIAKTCSVAFGGGQAVCQLEEGFVGASDQRRDGQAVGM